MMSAKVEKMIQEDRARIEGIVSDDLYRLEALQHKICPDCELKMVKKSVLWGLISWHACPECGQRGMKITGGPP